MATRSINFLVLAFALMAGSAQAALINVMNGDHNVIGGSSTGHLGLDGLGHTSTLLSDSVSGWATATGDNKIIVAEQRAVDSANTADVLSFMNGGGRLIMLGDTYGSTEAFMSSLFGTSVVTGNVSSSATSTKTSAAAGTTFADDAMTLTWLSSMHPVSAGLPVGSDVFYSGTAGDWVTRTAFGAGDLFYLGWDFCCGGTAARANDWYGVLDSAINYESSAVPEPSIVALFSLGLFGLGFARRRKA